LLSRDGKEEEKKSCWEKVRKRHKTLENKNRKFPIFLKSPTSPLSSSSSFIFALVVEPFFRKRGGGREIDPDGKKKMEAKKKKRSV
jgi:hypothetical protein